MDDRSRSSSAPALSYFVAPAFALASGVAFLVSELADLAVYTPLERRSWIGAVALSNTVGLVVDSMLFLALAFGSQEFLAGQVVGKAWMTLARCPGAAGRSAVGWGRVIHYHGTPITPAHVLLELAGRCFCVSLRRAARRSTSATRSANR